MNTGTSGTLRPGQIARVFVSHPPERERERVRLGETNGKTFRVTHRRWLVGLCRNPAADLGHYNLVDVRDDERNYSRPDVLQASYTADRCLAEYGTCN